MEREEFYAFFFGVVNLFLSRRHFSLAAAIDQINLFGAEPEGHSARVHRDISAAQYGNASSAPAGRVVAVLVVGFHQVGARQILVRSEYAYEIFALDVHELRQSCASADEYGVKAVLLDKVSDFAGASDNVVELDLDAESLQRVDLALDNGLRKAEFGNSVDENSPRLVEGFEHRDVMTCSRAVGGACDRRRSRSDYGYSFAGRCRLCRGCGNFAGGLLAGQICAESLDAADRHGLVDVAESLAHGAEFLTLLFLGAYASADGRKKRGLADDFKRAFEIPLGSLGQKAGDVDRYGASLHAGFGRTLQTAFRLGHRHFGGVSEGYLVHVAGAYGRILFRHRLGRDRHSLFGRHYSIPLKRLQACSRAAVSWALYAPLRRIIKSQST